MLRMVLPAVVGVRLGNVRWRRVLQCCRRRRRPPKAVARGVGIRVGMGGGEAWPYMPTSTALSSRREHYKKRMQPRCAIKKGLHGRPREREQGFLLCVQAA